MKKTVRPVRKAVLPVAGFGTRVLPASKSLPKEMLPVFNKPALHYVVEEAFQAGIEHVVLITGRNKSAIEDYFDHAYELEDSLKRKGKTELLDQLRKEIPPAGSLSFVRQQSADGLGHAVGCAEAIIGEEPFVVLLPDVLVEGSPSCLQQMISLYHTLGGGNLLAVEPVAKDQVHKYGIIAPKETEKLPTEQLFSNNPAIAMSGMVEKPSSKEAPSNFAITGRYLLQPEIFSFLKTQKRGAGGEIQLTDAMGQLMKTQDFYAYPFTGRSYDCGDLIGYLEAFMAYALKHETQGEKARETLQALLSS